MVKNLKKLRQQANMSQQQLADVIGVSQQSINKYENHNVEPDISTLSSIADLFSTSVDYLIGRTEIRENIMRDDLSFDEMRLIDNYRHINETEKEIIQLIIQNSK